MTEHRRRPDPHNIATVYERLFRSSTPLAKLKDAAFGGRLFDQTTEQDGVVGRSMAWKLFLISTVPLVPPANETVAKPPLESLLKHRKDYASFLLEKMRAPDGSYEEGFTVPGMPELPQPIEESTASLQRNNPLSLEKDNPWTDWFAGLDLRKLIFQDVERTFPDIDYFRDPDVQSQLTHILYVHSILHPDVGYRQGMHELLAPIYYALDFDSVSPEAELDPEISDFCSRTWVAADAWALFNVLMDGINAWYEWREPSPPSLPSPLQTQYRHGAVDKKVELKPYVAPIVIACQKLQAEMLKGVDPVLWQGMQKAGIEPQIYGIRWLRLLFTREFPLSDAMILWDGIFSCDNTFELAPWICIAMLIRIRNQLIPADYSGQLTYLLRYPRPPGNPSSSDPHHIILLLRQAFALYTAPNPSTGSSIISENRNILRIPTEVPTPEISPVSRRIHTPTSPRRSSSTEAARIAAMRAGINQNKSSQQPSQLSLPDLLARGLLEKGESLGINKTVMNAYSELRKNIPDFANQFIRTPTSGFSSYSSFPMSGERAIEERPPWEPRTRLEMEHEVAEMRTLHRKLGDAVSVAVDTLLRDEGNDIPDETLRRIKERKREAIEALSYVRDVLKGIATDVDEERLFGDEEYRRRKRLAQAELESSDSQKRSEVVSRSVRPPDPVIANRGSAEHRREQSSPPVLNSLPLANLPRTPPVFRLPQDTTSTGVTSRPSLSSRRAGVPQKSSIAGATSHSNEYHAPWNYTRTNFDSPSVGLSALPRPPPRTSSTLRPDGSSNSSGHDRPLSGQSPPAREHENTDPLGAIAR